MSMTIVLRCLRLNFFLSLSPFLYTQNTDRFIASLQQILYLSSGWYLRRWYCPSGNWPLHRSAVSGWDGESLTNTQIGLHSLNGIDPVMGAVASWKRRRSSSPSRDRSKKITSVKYLSNNICCGWKFFPFPPTFKQWRKRISLFLKDGDSSIWHVSHSVPLSQEASTIQICHSLVFNFHHLLYSFHTAWVWQGCIALSHSRILPCGQHMYLHTYPQTFIIISLVRSYFARAQ